ncbi:MAG: tetratricopeptide repeat protein, partial [Candidatus Omnitrophica bacterium]|nr:tetratricopeptide repeat protein [Candidatus Omnitrophota bacterium]
MPKIKIILLVLLVISALCLIAYSNSLHNPFIWDDLALVSKNPFIQTWRNALKSFSQELYSGTVASSNFYRPIQTISFILDYHFWGLDPFGYHLTNILFQILVSFLFFLFVYKITAKLPVSFLSAAFFCVSPLNTEAVTYVSGRAEMLMGIFLLSSFLLFASAQAKTGRLRVFYSIFSYYFFFFALLSKELSLVFPLIILGYLLYFCRDKFKKVYEIISPLLPFIIIALMYIVLRLAIFNFKTLYPPALTRFPLYVRLTVLPKIVFTYLSLLISPDNLHMSKTLVRPTSFIGIFLAWFLLGIGFVACLKILTNKKINKALPFFLLWALVFFLPQSGILPINAFIAEHFIYLSSISFFILAAYLLQRFLRKEVFIIASAGLLLFYGMLTYSRNADWKDPFVFYEKIIRLSPESFQAHNNLGFEYEQRNMLKMAELKYKMALELRPDLIEARSNLANVYYKSGRFKEAMEEYQIVKKSSPALKLGEVENNIGCIYEVEGFLDKALESYHLAVSLDPKLCFSRFNIAKIYQAQGKIDLSVQQIILSLEDTGGVKEKEPEYLDLTRKFLKEAKISCAAVFYNDLGVVFANKSFYNIAAASFKRAIEAEPYFSDAYFNLGLAYWNLGRKREAILACKRALKINPNHLRAKGFLS